MCTPPFLSAKAQYVYDPHSKISISEALVLFTNDGSFDEFI